MKNKRTLIAISAIAGIGVIAGTFAYFHDTWSADNEFRLTYEQITFQEHFDKPEDWTPCTETPKELIVKNTSSHSMSARVKVTESWKKLNATRTAETGDLPLVDSQNRAMAIVNYINTSDWVKVGDYYYYQHDIPAGGQSTAFTDKVTFSCDATNDPNGDDYSSANYHLVFDVEVIDSRGKTTWEGFQG